ncbi:probable metabolite transport protein CsbC [Hylaeus volcanicus]|uniref:probable metabolite transport protein CsbC n=1 Tax=Hylaeus volcanicus TaxID=313075 RepID=UPI0023B804BF|nr:probable metabolite transport protein CsbC [Hylaeus volcanicus]
MTVGAFLFGILIDASGRKGSIPVTMIIVFCASIVLSFAQTVFLIHLSMFMLGLGLAGNNVVLRVYLIELLPMKHRGSCMVILDVTEVIGYTTALGVSWLIIPSIVQLQYKRFRPNSWRVLTGLGGIPNLLLACVVSLLPPSPRYLLHRRRQEEALAVLQQMYAINNSKHADTYPIRNFDNCVEPVGDDEDERYDINNFAHTILVFCAKSSKQIRKLLKTRFKRTTILGIFISFLQIPGIAWMALWNTRLLQEMGKFESGAGINSTCTIAVQSMALGFLHDCREVDSDSFRLLLYLSLSYIIAEVFLLAGVDVVGRKLFLVFAGVIGATASLVLLFAVHSIARVVLSSIILATYVIGRTTTLLLLLENYSTGLRGTMIGLTRILPYLIASFMKQFLNVQCFYTIIFVSAVFLGAAVAGSQMPDLTRLPLQE